MGDEPERRPKQKYWGLRTLGFLGLALVAYLASSRMSGPLPLLGFVLGMTGAAYSSYRGVKDFSWLPR